MRQVLAAVTAAVTAARSEWLAQVLVYAALSY
jgi:hypothetical protein